MGKYDPPNFDNGRRTNPLIQPWYNSIQFLSKLSKIIQSQKNSWYYLTDADVITLFVASKGKKIQKNWQK